MKYTRYQPDKGKMVDMGIRDENKKSHVIEGTDIYLRLMNEEDTDRIIKWRNPEFVRQNFIYQE
ncbi:MAG: hypothetical protein K2M81_04960, partial [Lachnospiraceae bacterium]|nr:hypothetical protein [Lachnospiraceae bacterium]